MVLQTLTRKGSKRGASELIETDLRRQATEWIYSITVQKTKSSSR